MEGPYRDLGEGFARLAGVEGLRRSPRAIRSVEDALLELLRNARDAGAHNIYVATSLGSRRYRRLVVLDDGQGIPETHKHLVFEPGVTTRHLQNVHHGAGLSLYHLKNAAVSAEVLSAASPTAVKAVFDTQTLPEKSLQSTNPARPSKTNLPATLATFAQQPNAPRLYHASPARILARLLDDHIIQTHERDAARRVWGEAGALGLEVSLRTAQRVVSGGIAPAAEEVVFRGDGGGAAPRRGLGRRGGVGGPILSLGAEDLDEISAALRRAARSRYLDLDGLVQFEGRPGEVILRARVYEPEDEYE